MRLIWLFLFLTSSVFGQIGTGQWRLHVPNNKAIDIVAKNNVLYTAFESGLMEYDIDANEVSLWDNVNGLSDIQISCLGYEPVSKSVFIGYENGNLDQIKNNSVTNIPAIVLAQIQGSKKIHKIVSHEGYVYLATGFSIVKIDPDKQEVKDTYYPTNGNVPIVDIAFRNDSIYALTKTQMYSGRTNNIALADPTQWIVDSRIQPLTDPDVTYENIEVIGQDLFIQKNRSAYGIDSVYKVLDNSWDLVTNLGFELEIESLSTVNGKLAVHCDGISIVYNDDYSFFQVVNAYTFGGTPKPSNIVYVDNIFWVADQNNGLVRYFDEYSTSVISFPGPPRNEFYSMDWEDGKLVVAAGGIKGKNPIYTPPGVYIFEEEDWTQKSKENMTLWSNAQIWDNLTVSINPKDKNQIATGAYSNVPLSLLNIDGQVTDTFSYLNSTLTQSSEGNGLTLVSDVQYDNSGNLWMLNGFSSQPLKLMTSDKDWYAFSCGSQAINRLTYKMAIDYNDNIWFSVFDNGLIGYQPGSSITDPSDDKYIALNIGPNSGALPSNGVTCVAVDFDNEIWIGTDNGFAVLYNSNNAFDAAPGEYNAQRIKLEFEGNVEYVLGNTFITDIEVDGANRKWFGTSNSGVILLSPDGLEIVKQFTKENSPLISDNIIDIEIDHKTGEVYIITDLGLVSYRGDATYEDPDYSDVQIFPNPARPDFDGPITIQGIRYDSDVKITDVSGNVVFKTTSNGGTATWNGRMLDGTPVQTGVYLIWTAPNESKGRFVGKVLVVN